MLRRCDLIDTWTRYRALTFAHPEHGLMPFAAHRWLPPPLHLNRALAGLTFLTASQKRQIRSALWRLMRTPADALISVTAEDWLVGQNQSESTRREFWDVILVSALGDRSANVSMAAARKVMLDGFAAARDAGDVYVPNRPLSQIFGPPMVDVLKRLDVDVRLNVTMRRLQMIGQRIGVHLNSVAGGETIHADRVILATAWHQTRKLMEASDSPELVPPGLGSLRSSPITGVHLWLDRPLTDLPHVAMVGTVSQWLFREPLRQTVDGDAGVYHQVVISGEHRFSDSPRAALVEHVMGELRHAFPDAGDVRCRQSRVVTDPHSVFSASPQSFADRPVCQTSDPRLFLAGDWVQTGWPATMEGAVRGGRMAAAAVVDAIGRDVAGLDGACAPGIEPSVNLPRGWLAGVLIRR